ncbi:hypothetical protein PAAG_11306 [Paracoccidioides lutzii Pb01]|uniref:Uncharacterized protein n=1 Tax=Paracoccidioides lutzii (strain ATCC MYA-826 / Pb01) TaxID=502779 RepID=A0A0A2V285_PARBA|nr:hypothetical protein PAAG_11306 [Paracoccidioides lutzii Pb01]KGQ01916.1 hypothetical protein PAAG_11306 [Paracoccidioides lutzii Pb01]
MSSLGAWYGEGTTCDCRLDFTHWVPRHVLLHDTDKKERGLINASIVWCVGGELQNISLLDAVTSYDATCLEDSAITASSAVIFQEILNFKTFGSQTKLLELVVSIDRHDHPGTFDRTLSHINPPAFLQTLHRYQRLPTTLHWSPF